MLSHDTSFWEKKFQMSISKVIQINTGSDNVKKHGETIKKTRSPTTHLCWKVRSPTPGKRCSCKSAFHRWWSSCSAVDWTSLCTSGSCTWCWSPRKQPPWWSRRRPKRPLWRTQFCSPSCVLLSAMSCLLAGVWKSSREWKGKEIKDMGSLWGDKHWYVGWKNKVLFVFQLTTCNGRVVLLLNDVKRGFWMRSLIT